jgi:hypothetical protein
MKLFTIKYALKGRSEKTIITAAYKRTDIDRLYIKEIKAEHGNNIAYINVASVPYKTPCYI